MNLDKDTLHSLSDFLSKFVVLIVPGLMINELVFHKGFYGGGISNIYDLLLLLVWSAVYSIPYYACMILNIYWHTISSKEALKKAETDPTTFEVGMPLLLFLMTINYVIYKIMLSMNWMSTAVNLGILQQNILLVVSVIITCIISFPAGKLYFFLIDKFIRKIATAIKARMNI